MLTKGKQQRQLRVRNASISWEIEVAGVKLYIANISWPIHIKARAADVSFVVNGIRSDLLRGFTGSQSTSSDLQPDCGKDVASSPSEKGATDATPLSQDKDGSNAESPDATPPSSRGRVKR